MSKIVFDADGLIKLVKSGVFKWIKHKCIISEQVHNETVNEGKKRLYADAYQIEKMIHQGKIKVNKAGLTMENYELGKGELSTLALFRKEKADAIVSDDKRFLRLLEEQEIAFIIPTEFIVALVTNKQINRKKGQEALNKIKDLINKQNYKIAYKALGGKP